MYLSHNQMVHIQFDHHPHLIAVLSLRKTLTPYQLCGAFLQLRLTFDSLVEVGRKKEENLMVLFWLSRRFLLSFLIIQIIFCTCTVSAHRLSLAKMGTKLSCLIIPKHSKEKIANDWEHNSHYDSMGTSICVWYCAHIYIYLCMFSWSLFFWIPSVMSIIWATYGCILVNSRQLHFN